MKYLGFFARLRIGTRVYGRFGVTLVLVAALGVLGVVSLNGTRTSFVCYAAITASSIKVAEINVEFSAARRDIFAYASTGQERARASARTILSDLQEKITPIVQGMQPGPRKTALEGVGRSIKVYAANVEKVVAERASRDQADAVLVKTGPEATEAIDKVVKAAAFDGQFEAAVSAG